jgi:hypothetical protein
VFIESGRVLSVLKHKTHERKQQEEYQDGSKKLLKDITHWALVVFAQVVEAYEQFVLRGKTVTLAFLPQGEVHEWLVSALSRNLLEMQTLTTSNMACWSEYAFCKILKQFICMLKFEKYCSKANLSWSSCFPLGYGRPLEKMEKLITTFICIYFHLMQ